MGLIPATAGGFIPFEERSNGIGNPPTPRWVTEYVTHRRGCAAAAVCFTRTSEGQMGGRITALRFQKRNRDRVNVYLDGRFAFGLAAIEAAHLRVGQILSDEEIARLKERDQAERAVQRAMGLLSYRPRSEAEIRRRLRQKGHDEATIVEALGRLRRTGLLDDESFARYWVENRFQFNPRGVMALRQELRQKGVEDRIIEAVLAEYDEEEAAARAVERAARRLHRLDGPTFRRRLSDYLRRRGFPYEVIRPLVEQAAAAHAAEGTLEENEG